MVAVMVSASLIYIGGMILPMPILIVSSDASDPFHPERSPSNGFGKPVGR